MATFDYVFYRLYKFYIGQGSSVTHTYASSLVTVLQTFMVLLFYALLSLFIEVSTFNKLYIFLVAVPLFIINWYRYERDFDIQKYEERWGDEPKAERRKKRWLIVLWFVIAILIPVGIGILRNNYGVI